MSVCSVCSESVSKIVYRHQSQCSHSASVFLRTKKLSRGIFLGGHAGFSWAATDLGIMAANAGGNEEALPRRVPAVPQEVINGMTRETLHSLLKPAEQKNTQVNPGTIIKLKKRY